MPVMVINLNKSNKPKDLSLIKQASSDTKLIGLSQKYSQLYQIGKFYFFYDFFLQDFFFFLFCLFPIATLEIVIFNFCFPFPIYQ